MGGDLAGGPLGSIHHFAIQYPIPAGGTLCWTLKLPPLCWVAPDSTTNFFSLGRGKRGQRGTPRLSLLLRLTACLPTVLV